MGGAVLDSGIELPANPVVVCAAWPEQGVSAYICGELVCATTAGIPVSIRQSCRTPSDPAH